MTSSIRSNAYRWLAAMFAVALVLGLLVGSSQNTAQAIDPGETDIAYVADGYNFPDALMGATLAGLNTAPMLGVRSPTTGDAVPPETAGELDRLTNNKANLLDTIYVFGGPAAVSDKVVGELGAWANNVERIFGADRFATMTEISEALPSKARDSDLLDGMDSTDFLGATEKAADSDKVDGLDANAISRVAYDFTSGVALDGTDGTAASTTITAPTDGLLVLSGSLDLVNFSTVDTEDCRFVVDGTALDNAFSQTVDGGIMQVVNMSLDGVEPVASGSHTVDIECLDVDPDTDVTDPFLVVQFVPFGPDGTPPTP